MKVRHRLYLTSALVILLLAVLCPSIYLTNAHLQEESRTHDLVDKLERDLSDLRFVTNEYVWYGERRMYQQWYTKFSEIETEVERLSRGMPLGDATVKSVLGHLDQLNGLFAGVVRTMQLEPLTRAGAIDPHARGEAARVRRLYTHLMLETRAVSSGVDDLAQRAHSRLFEAQGAAVRGVGSLSLLLCFLGLAAIAFWLVTVGTLLGRMGTLLRGIQMLGRGNLDYRVPVDSRDEFGEVSLAFNQMLTHLKESTVSINVLTREVEERRRAEAAVAEKSRLVDLLQRIAIKANEAHTPQEAMRSALELVCEFLGWPVGHLYVKEEDSTVMRPTAVWHLSDSERFETFRFFSERTPMPLGVGLPGRVAAQKRTVWIEEFDLADVPRMAYARDAGLKSALAFPLVSGSEMQAVMEFFTTERIQPSAQLLDAMGTIGVQMGRVMERAHADHAKTLLASLVEASADALVTVSAEGKITSWNHAAERVFGYSEGEAVGMPIAALGAPDEDSELLDRCRAGALVTGQETRRQRKDGQWIDVSLSAAPLLNEDRAISGVSLCARDVSELKRAEHALRESERRFRMLFSGNPKPMWVSDAETYRILEVNDAAVQHYGYSREEFLGMTLFELRPKNDWAAFEQHITSGTSTYGCDGKTKPWRHVRRDGSIISVEIAAEKVSLWGRSCWVAVANDITERLRIEEALRNEQARLKLVLDQMPAILWSTDRDLKINFITGHGIELIGMRAQDFLGMNLYTLQPESGTAYPVLDSHLRAVGGESVSYEVVSRAHTFAAHVEPFLGGDGATLGVIGVAIDISERTRAEEALKQLAADLVRSNQELEEFAYVASHDLQEPLRMITCYLNLLRQRYGGKLGRDGDDFIAFAVDGAERMKGLIGDLLAYSRVGNHERPLEAVDCEALLPKVLENLKVSLEETGAEVSWGPLPTIKGDPVQLAQLFQNLVGNALKFRRSGISPKISISAARDDDEWQFCVRDNGIGIEPENSERVFHIFQRLHTREEYPGTGVGLAICKKIVQRHGGRIWVESEPGRGSKFCFTFSDGPTPRLVLSTREGLQLMHGT